jgi:D-alanyl-D-alanine carboxypeptidase
MSIANNLWIDATARGIAALTLLSTLVTVPLNADGADVDALLRERLADGDAPGLQYRFVSADSIIHRFDGGLADVRRAVPVTARTRFNGFSVTKTFTAIAVLQLAERGTLGLDDRASKYLPDFPYPADITVRQLLTHSAGIPNPIPLRWTHLAAEHATFDRDAFFRGLFAEHGRVKSAPNAKFAYSNLGYHLLGQVIEKVSGLTYEEYVTRNIIAPLGIAPADLSFELVGSVQASGYHKRWSMTYPLLGFLMDRERAFEGREDGWQKFRPYYMNGPAYGGLIGTADGFARYVQALLDTSSTILSLASRQALFTENLLAGGKRSGMALSWFIGAVDDQPFFDHAGGGGGYYAELRLYPGLKRGSVLLMNRTGMTNSRILDVVDRPVLRSVKVQETRAP